MDCPNVADWVAALVCWAGDRIWRAGAPHVVGEGSVGLQGVANKTYLKYTDWKHLLLFFPSFRLQALLDMFSIHSIADMLCSSDKHSTFHQVRLLPTVVVVIEINSEVYMNSTMVFFDQYVLLDYIWLLSSANKSLWCWIFTYLGHEEKHWI